MMEGSGACEAGRSCQSLNYKEVRTAVGFVLQGHGVQAAFPFRPYSCQMGRRSGPGGAG